MSNLEGLILLCKENILFLHPDAGYQLSDLKCITFHTFSGDTHYLNAAIITIKRHSDNTDEKTMRFTTLAQGRASETDRDPAGLNVAAMEDMLENLRDRVGFFAAALANEMAVPEKMHADIPVAKNGKPFLKKRKRDQSCNILVAEGKLMTENEYRGARRAVANGNSQGRNVIMESGGGSEQVEQEPRGAVRVKLESGEHA